MDATQYFAGVLACHLEGQIGRQNGITCGKFGTVQVLVLVLVLLFLLEHAQE